MRIWTVVTEKNNNIDHEIIRIWTVVTENNNNIDHEIIRIQRTITTLIMRLLEYGQ